MRKHNELEERNIKFLLDHNVNFTQVETTATGLDKCIMDSTAPMRTYFLENGIHDYSAQPQGQCYKEFRAACIITPTEMVQTKVSFYRPETKKGDPRMWIYTLGRYSEGNDIHALFWHDETLFSINITQIDIAKYYYSKIINPIHDILSDIDREGNYVANELLHKFIAVSNQWFKAEVTADTGIGRTIESYLGIKMNSDKTPDFKGIELKSHRDKRSNNRNVLFTQTPDWDISNLRSGREIAEKYGYLDSRGEKTYRNTVQCNVLNSQNLFLYINETEDNLELWAKKRKYEDVVAWRLMNLHQRLLTKHHETFWIEVENVIRDGEEYFRYKKIEHTKNPNVGQFDILLEQGVITVDLLLNRSNGHGDTYSFKIKKKGMELLFPDSITYVI